MTTKLHVAEDRLHFVQAQHPGGAGVLWEVRLDAEDGPLVARVSDGLITGKLKILRATDDEILFEDKTGDREKAVEWLCEHAMRLISENKAR